MLLKSLSAPTKSRATAAIVGMARQLISEFAELDEEKNLALIQQVLSSSPLLRRDSSSLSHQLFQGALFRIAWSLSVDQWNQLKGTHIADKNLTIFGRLFTFTGPGANTQPLGRLSLGDWKGWSVASFQELGADWIADHLALFSRELWESFAPSLRKPIYLHADPGASRKRPVTLLRDAILANLTPSPGA